MMAWTAGSSMRLGSIVCLTLALMPRTHFSDGLSKDPPRRDVRVLVWRPVLHPRERKPEREGRAPGTSFWGDQQRL